MGHDHIGSEHLLLGMLSYDKTPAFQVLKSLGLQLEQVRHEVVNLLGQSDPMTESRKRKQEIDDELEKHPTIKTLRHEIEQLQGQKEAAIEDQNFNLAATLRDQADLLHKEIAIQKKKLQ